MTLFLMSLLIFLLAMLGMGVGMIAGRSPIKGSCGGAHGIKGLGNQCAACDKPCPDREKAESRHF